MATLHKEFIEFNRAIKLSDKKKEELKASRKEIRRKIRSWFKDNKPDELQPKFYGQGSYEMDTIITPIVEEDSEGNKLYKYDLDDGVYFIEKEDQDNKRSIVTWHDWVYSAVENHTNTPPERKTTCVRVIYADGHHIDLPIYYKDGNIPELAHKSKGWIESDPKKFKDWFLENVNGCEQKRRIVRYLKAWKNYRELNNTNLFLPSGFALSILVEENYVSNDNDDDAFKKTVEKIKETLDAKFECIRPTTPIENVFIEFSETRKNNFLTALQSLIDDCNRADNEKNFKKASEIMQKQFGDRFPKGRDESEEAKSNRLGSSLAGSAIKPKPYAE